MFKATKLSGLITIFTLLTLVLVLFMISSQAEDFKAVYVKLALLNLCAVFASAGVYLSLKHITHAGKLARRFNLVASATVVLFASLVSFNVLPFAQYWNWAVVLMLLFILLIQLQLLQWGKLVPTSVRFISLFVLLSDVFLIFFFITLWPSYLLESWINLSAATSVILTITGMLLLKDKQTENS